MTRRSISGGAVAAVAVLGLVLVLALGLAACGTTTGGGGGGSPSSSSDQPKQGGTLTLSYLTEPSSLDPAIAWNVIDWQIEHDIYQGFLQYAHEPGQAGTQLIPCLATEVPSAANGGISADGKTYTFHLRKGVKFQPPVSREVTAADFKYSFERMMLEPRAPATSFYMGVVGADAFMKGKAKEITGFKAVDDYTVEITLKSPDLSFLNAVTMDFCDVVPKEWVDKWGKQFNRHPLGTGPFVFQKWTPGREIVLTRNPQYWEQGKPYLDTIDYQLSFSPSTALLKLQRGEVDVLGDGVPDRRPGARPGRPQVEAADLHPAARRDQLHVHERRHEAVRQRQGPPGAQLGDQSRQAGEAPGRAGDELSGSSIPRACRAMRRARSTTGTTRPRPSSCSPKPGIPNGFKTMLYTDNVDPNPKLMASRSRPTSPPSASRPASRR